MHVPQHVATRLAIAAARVVAGRLLHVDAVEMATGTSRQGRAALAEVHRA